MNLYKSVPVIVMLGLVFAACGGSDAAAFCDTVEGLNSLDATEDIDLSADDPGEAMQTAFNEMEEAFSDLQESAPEEIEADLALLSDGISTLSDALEEAGGDLFALAADPEMVEKLEALDGPEFDQAVANIEEYASSECGVELS